MSPPEASEFLLVFTTFPDLATARQIGTRLVEEQVAACVNLLPGGESIFRWQGIVESSAEVPARIKTTRASYPALEAALIRLHPYDVPGIVAVPLAAGSPDYLRWIGENVSG